MSEKKESECKHEKFEFDIYERAWRCAECQKLLRMDYIDED